MWAKISSAQFKHWFHCKNTICKLQTSNKTCIFSTESIMWGNNLLKAFSLRTPTRLCICFMCVFIKDNTGLHSNNTGNKCSASPAASWVKRRKIIIYLVCVGSNTELIPEETLTAVVCLAGRGQRQEKWVKPCSFTLPVVRGDYNCNAYCNCFDIFHTRFLWAGMCRPRGVVVLLQRCWAWHVRSPVEKEGNGASRNPETFGFT